MKTNTKQTLLSAAILTASAWPACAASVDPATGIQNLVTYAIALAAVIFSGMFVWKGIHAFQEGRHFMPHVYAAIGGLALAFGGSYIMQHYGVTGVVVQ